MARFTELIGVTFGEPISIKFDDVVEDGAHTDRLMRVIYSVEGPPFLELIEAQEDGVWGRQHGKASTTSACGRTASTPESPSSPPPAPSRRQSSTISAKRSRCTSPPRQPTELVSNS
jgi:hypothetical protein